MIRARGVVMFTPGLTEPGGAGRRSNLLATELCRRGWQVRVITRAGTLHRFVSTTSPGMKAVEVPGFSAPRIGALLFLIVAIPLGLWWGLRSRVFLTVQLTSQTTAGAICSFLLRRPLIALLTTGGSVSETAYIRNSRIRHLRRALLSKATMLVAQTEHAAQDLALLIPSARVEILPNPVRTMEDTPLNGEPLVLFAGRFSHEKDLNVLLDAWEEVVADDQAARLTLLGEGGAYRSVESELRSRIAMSSALKETVTLPGWVADIDMYLLSHDVFAFTSRSEGMSNSLLEAVAAGRVIVASDIASNIAVLGSEHPLFFRTGDATDLLRALKAAIYDDKLRTVALQNVRNRAPLFRTEIFLDKVEALIDSCA